MADRYPLIINSAQSQIQELASGDNLDLLNNNIVNASDIDAANIVATTVTIDGSIAGTRDILNSVITLPYTVQLTDTGKMLVYTSSGVGTITMTDSTFDVGTTITLVNLSSDSSDVTLDINSLNIILAGDGDVSNRTLHVYGIATLVKVTSTDWLISGVGLE